MFYTILLPLYALSLGFDAAEEVSARFRVATVLPGAWTLEIRTGRVTQYSDWVRSVFG